MKALEIRPNIYWVGVVDWNCRNFHGYDASRGVTYNAYLIIDEKITLIDNVHHSLAPQMIEYISSVIDPSKIDVIISNHAEPDHSGSLPLVLQYAKGAKVYASPNGEKVIKAHYGDIQVEVVKNNDILSLGKRSLRFIHTTMVHWPDNMVSYCEEEKILFSNDAFGQHIASSERYDFEYPRDIFIAEMKKYYANIVLPYSNQAKNAVKAVKTLELDLICPSHGLIIKDRIEEVLDLYDKMTSHVKIPRAVIVYDSMWGSTEKIALSIAEAFINNNIPVSFYNLSNNHQSNIIADVMESQYLVVGSSTLNNGMLTSVAAFLHYIKGLKPANIEYIAFGSYGWGGQSPDLIDAELAAMNYKQMLPPIKAYFVPNKDVQKEIYDKVAKALK